MIGHAGLTVVALVVIALVAWSWVRDLRRDRGLTRPLASVAGLYGRALVLYVAASAYWLSRGFASGGGRRGSACVDTGFPAGGGGGPGHAARAGALLGTTGNIQACALHPGAAQWALFFLTKIPGVALWGLLLLLVWQLVSRAGRTGPFTAQTAASMRRLGWAVVGGSLIAGALGALGADLMTRMLMTPATYSGAGVAADVLIYAPLRALLPVPALAGAALLTFARITRAAAVMDEEIKATV
jgi:hypothetical protein